MTIEGTSVERDELVEDERVAFEDARDVHDLGEAERLLVTEERREGTRVEDACAVGFELGRRHTRADHDAEVELQAA